MNFDVTVWGLRVCGELREYEFEEASGYDLDCIDDVGIEQDGKTYWMPQEFVMRLADWSEFAEAVLTEALDKLDT